MADETAPAAEAQATVEETHGRMVTPVGDGQLKVGAHSHPYRIYEGRVQYQLKDGTWKDAPDTAERV